MTFRALKSFFPFFLFVLLLFFVSLRRGGGGGGAPRSLYLSLPAHSPWPLLLFGPLAKWGWGWRRRASSVLSSTAAYLVELRANICFYVVSEVILEEKWLFSLFPADRLLPACDRTPLEFQGNARRLRPRLIFSELRAGFCTDIPGRKGEDIGFNLTFTAFSANLRRPVAIRNSGGFFFLKVTRLFFTALGKVAKNT